MIRTNWSILKRSENVDTITEVTVSLGTIVSFSILTMFVKIFWNLAFAEHGNVAKDIQKTADIGREKKVVVEMIFVNIFIMSPNGIM